MTKMPHKISKQGWTIFGLVVIFFIFFTALSFWKYSNFLYDNLDLAIFNNVFFNTLAGMPFGASIHPPTYLGDHFTPIIFALIPIYSLSPTPQTLLLIQAFVLALCAWPIYLIAKEFLQGLHKSLPVGIAALWLINPSVHNVSLFEFHLLPIGVFFLFWAFYFYQRKKFIFFIIAAIIALLVREDIAFIILFFSILSFIDKREALWKFVPGLLALSYSVISFSVVQIFAPANTYKFSTYYSWLGGETIPEIAVSFITHPLQVIGHILTFPNLEFILGLTFPFFFIVLALNRYIVLLIPPLAQIWLGASGGSALVLMTHFSLFFLFTLFISLIAIIKNIEHSKWPRALPKLFRKKSWWYAIIPLASFYGSLTYGAIVPVLTYTPDDARTTDITTILSQVPEDAAVATTFQLLTPLSSREKIYSLHYAYIGKGQFSINDYSLPDDTEYLVIDWEDMLRAQIHFEEHHSWGAFTGTMHERLNTILSQFELIDSEGSLMLLHRSDNIQPLATIVDEVLEQPETDPVITSLSDRYLSITIPSNPLPEKKYALRIQTSERVYTVPLSYGLYPSSTWFDKEVLLMHLFDSDIKKITLLSWKDGNLALGKLKNLATHVTYETIQEFQPYTQ